MGALALQAPGGAGGGAARAKGRLASGRQRPPLTSPPPPPAPRAAGSPGSCGRPPEGAGRRGRRPPGGRGAGRRLPPGLLLARGAPVQSGERGAREASERRECSCEVPPRPPERRGKAGTRSPLGPGAGAPEGWGDGERPGERQGPRRGRKGPEAPRARPGRKGVWERGRVGAGACPTARASPPWQSADRPGPPPGPPQGRFEAAGAGPRGCRCSAASKRTRSVGKIPHLPLSSTCPDARSKPVCRYGDFHSRSQASAASPVGRLSRSQPPGTPCGGWRRLQRSTEGRHE